MVFGSQQCFAIEASEPTILDGKAYSQFQFWIDGVSVGDWDDAIPLRASVEYMSQFCCHQFARIDSKFRSDSKVELFDAVYDRFYRTDYSESDESVRRLRDVFHLDDIGMSSIVDKFGIVLVAADTAVARLIWKEWAHSEVTHEHSLAFGEVERVGQLFVKWGTSRTNAER